MNGLTILSAVFFALGVTLALILAVVSLLMGLNLDASPGLREEWPLLLTLTGLFAVFCLPAGLAWWSLRRRWSAWPLLQGTLWASVGFVALIVRNLILP